MAKTSRPIRIQIPEELKLSEVEIFTLEQAFGRQLVIVNEPGDPPLPTAPVNTTKPPIQVEVVSLQRSRIRQGAQKSARKSAKKSGKSRK